MHKLLIELIRFVLGAIFVLSSLLKAVDPYGVSYKIYDYLNLFFGYAAVELRTAAMAMAVGLCFFEFVLGAFLLMGIYRRLTARLSVLLLIFFTALTAYTYWDSPIKECGCFGDALEMTAGETFLKNLILLPLSIYLLRYARRARTLFSRLERWFFSFLAIVGILVFIYANINYLPYRDFRPYKVGLNLREQRVQAEQAYLEELLSNTYYLYEKSGRQERFRADSLPDSTWKFVAPMEQLDQWAPAFEVPNFDVYDLDERWVTEEVLTDTAGVFLLLSPSWADASLAHSEVLNELYDYATKLGYKFYGVSPSRFEDVVEWRYQTGSEYDMLTMDATTIRTIIRSNPGLLIMKNGQIMNKLSMNMLPSIEDIPTFVERSLAKPQSLSYAQWRVAPLAVWLLGYLIGVLRLWIRQISALIYIKRRGKAAQIVHE